MATKKLPPGVVELESGKLVRRVERLASDGSTWMQERPVALDLEEARAGRMDYYHPELGWILEGYKLEKDRTVESRLADTSTSIPAMT